MSNKINEKNIEPNLPQESPNPTISELVRSISHQFRRAIREQKENQGSSFQVKDFEHVKNRDSSA